MTIYMTVEMNLDKVTTDCRRFLKCMKTALSSFHSAHSIIMIAWSVKVLNCIDQCTILEGVSCLCKGMLLLLKGSLKETDYNGNTGLVFTVVQ